MGEKKTNYDKMREDAEQRFLAYDQLILHSSLLFHFFKYCSRFS